MQRLTQRERSVVHAVQWRGDNPEEVLEWWRTYGWGGRVEIQQINGTGCYEGCIVLEEYVGDEPGFHPYLNLGRWAFREDGVRRVNWFDREVMAQYRLLGDDEDGGE